jgi:hypothetical protein
MGPDAAKLTQYPPIHWLFDRMGRQIPQLD